MICQIHQTFLLYGATWNRNWKVKLSGISEDVRVLLESTAVTTPLLIAQWQKFLVKYPNRALVNIYIFSISQGFKLGFNNLSSLLKSAQWNQIPSNQHPCLPKILHTAHQESLVEEMFNELTLFEHLAKDSLAN